jgi:hypothetical protein
MERTNVNTTPKKCIKCSNNFIPTSNNQKNCLNCGSNTKEWKKEWSKKNKKICNKRSLDWFHNFRTNNPEKYLFKHAKKRARLKGLEFDLSEEDIIIPEYCPVLGIKLKFGINSDKNSSPSIDRIDNAQGYLKHNIRVISHRANTLKRDATLEEIEKVFKWLKTTMSKEKE